MCDKEEKVTICTLQEYLNILDKLKKEDTTNRTRPNPTASSFLYRGMSGAELSLCPGFFRKKKDEPSGNETDLYSYTTEKEMLRAFRREAMAYVKEILPSNHIAWYELAQHHGVPTRFLDWTSNPLAALYFACVSNNGKNAAIWGLHEKNYGIKTQGVPSKETVEEKIVKELEGVNCFEFPLIYVPYYRDLRMSAQSSVFMVWGSNHEHLEKMFGSESHMKYDTKKEEFQSVATDQNTPFLFKVEVDSQSKLSLIRQLDEIGINKKTLFPGLDGIGQYLESKYRIEDSREIEEQIWGTMKK